MLSPQERFSAALFIMGLRKDDSHGLAMHKVEQLEAWAFGRDWTKSSEKEAPSAPNGESVSKPPRIDDLEVLGKLQGVSEALGASKHVYDFLPNQAKDAVMQLEKLIHDLLAGRELP